MQAVNSDRCVHLRNQRPVRQQMPATLPSPRVGPSRPSSRVRCPALGTWGDSSPWSSGRAASSAAEQCRSLRTAHCPLPVPRGWACGSFPATAGTHSLTTVSSAECGGTWEPLSGRAAQVLATVVTAERFSLCCPCAGTRASGTVFTGQPRFALSCPHVPPARGLPRGADRGAESSEGPCP